MNDRYLIFYNPHWLNYMDYSKKPIDGNVKLYIRKNNGLPDKRYVEYKRLVKEKPDFSIFTGEVKIK